MLVAGCEPNQLGPSRIEPQPECASPGGTSQMLDDQRPNCVERRGVDCRCAPTVPGVRWRRESQWVAGVVIGYVSIGDVDGGRDVDEHRPCQRIGQCRRRDAADLQPRRIVWQQFIFRRCAVRWSGPPQRPRRRLPARSPTAASASGATAVPRWYPPAVAPRQALSPAAAPPARRRPQRARSKPATVAATCAWLIGPSPSRQASRATVRRSQPEPAPTTRRAAPTAAGRHRTRVPPSRPATAQRPARRDRSTPRFPTG